MMQTFFTTFLLAATLSLGSVPGAVAQSVAPSTSATVRPEVQRLVETLRMPEIAAVMRDEGLAHGVTLETEMFPQRGGKGWTGAVARIYDPERMLAGFTARLDRALAKDDAALARMQDFFDSPLGSRIIGLEVEGRRTLADDAAEEAANVMVEDMIANQDPRMVALRALVEAGDLVERNVTGALNANLAFYRGMAEGNAAGLDVTEEQMLEDVWMQEPEVRVETERWLYSYMALAYAPLSDAELAEYQTFSESDAGRAMNAALFTAFDETFVGISREMGRAAAVQMQGQDI